MMKKKEKSGGKEDGQMDTRAHMHTDVRILLTNHYYAELVPLRTSIVFFSLTALWLTQNDYHTLKNS